MREEELAARLRHADVAESVGLISLGTCMGDWRLTAFIAHGGTSDVYCAEHVALGTTAAVKVLRSTVPEAPSPRGAESLILKSSFDDAARRGRPGCSVRAARFRREAKLLSELKSPSFPRFYAYGTSSGHDYLVEELLEPRDLPKGNRVAHRFLLTLCDAVGELHALGLVHCDIKPANILFRPSSGEPVLVDLGLAMSAAEDANGGTPGYSAPEQFLGGEITPAADIHALGVLAERLGFKGRGIIRRATSSIPAERFKTVGEFTRALRSRQLCRRMAVVLVVAVAAAALFVGLSLIVGRGIPDEIVLKSETLVLRKPLHIPTGRTIRVIGPGTLDAAITGEKGARLWMTNCVVINRAKKIFPVIPLYYEISNGVYLNFINANCPSVPWRRSDYFNLYDGAFNEVRHRGPATLAELRRLHNTESGRRTQEERRL